jgi:hypothetical protein
MIQTVSARKMDVKRRNLPAKYVQVSCICQICFNEGPHQFRLLREDVIFERRSSFMGYNACIGPQPRFRCVTSV